MKKNISSSLFYTAVVFCIAMFTLQIKTMTNSGRKDFRPQVIGARLLFAKEANIYFYKQKASTPEYFLDTADDDMYAMNNVTMTPTLLLFSIPLALLPYPYAIFLWTVWNYFILFCFLYFLFKQDKELDKKSVFTFFSFFLIGSAALLWHIVECQKYLTFGLLLALIYWFGFERKSFFIVGILACILFLFRLNTGFALFILLFLLDKEAKLVYIKGALTGFILIFILSFGVDGLDDWKSYFSAMPLWSKIGMDEASINTNAVASSVTELEGVTRADIPSYFPFNDTLVHNNSSLQRWIYKFTHLKINAFLFLCVYLVLASVLTFYYLRIKTAWNKQHLDYLFFFFLYLLSELFLPIHRLPYYYTQWFFPLLLLFSYYVQTGKIAVWLTVLFWVGVTFNLVVLAFIPYSCILSEYTLLLFLFCFLFSPHRYREYEKNKIIA
jgi:hypothetical protein